MANMKYFSDWNGQTVELRNPHGVRNERFAELFPGVRGLRYDSFSRRVGFAKNGTDLLPVTRIIEYKQRPSLHECSAKCMSGSHRGVCECRCGGKNHGVAA